MHMTSTVHNPFLRAQLSSLGGHWVLTSVRANRMSDIMHYGCAVVSLLLLAPLFLVIGLMVKLTSRGPILERRLRVGEDGRTFTLYTFCTLRADAEAQDGAQLPTDRDAKYTRIGRWLKRTKLDHLPQLVNILKGDMHFLGPQPARPLFLQQLGGEMPRFPELVHVGSSRPSAGTQGNL
jgi:lipopolysaccharide/colanic/teichoic acid biosynthesis glycosyltransferase